MFILEPMLWLSELSCLLQQQHPYGHLFSTQQLYLWSSSLQCARKATAVPPGRFLQGRLFLFLLFPCVMCSPSPTFSRQK